MSLEERIKQSVGLALDDMRARMEQEVRAIAQELVASAAEERQLAVATAREAALAEVDERVRAATQEVDARLRSAADETDARVREATEAAEARVRAELEASVARAHVDERDADMAGLARLLDAIRSLDRATSLSEVLDGLGRAAAGESERAALLVLRGDRLVGWMLAGFEALDAQPKSVDLAQADAGIAGTAATAMRPVTTGEGGAAPTFAALPADRLGLAVPVVVGGRAVAVVYADTANADHQTVVVPSGWPEVLEVLARHAGRCLEALTNQRVGQPPPAPKSSWVPA